MLKSKKNILIKITGSIAAYKICFLISRLVQAGYSVKVAVSESALQFIGKATLEGLSGSVVYSDSFADGKMMSHIELNRWADLILTAPATANYLNKMAAGLGDDLLSTLFLAHDFQKPYLIAPAMNTKMYQHPITQQSIQKLQGLGIHILETASGVLACGEVGEGKLLDPDLIFAEVEKYLHADQGPKVLITGGGTTEPIDQVRGITNLSTGKTAATLADELTDQGFRVEYLAAKNSILPRKVGSIDEYVSFADLAKLMQEKLSKENYVAIVHAAAVSDFHVEEILAPAIVDAKNLGKIPSDQIENLHIKLGKNPKIVDSLKKSFPDSLLVAFKLTSTFEEDERLAAVEKLQKHSHADLIVHNDTHDIDLKNGKHLFSVYRQNGIVASTNGPQGLANWLASYIKNPSQEVGL